LVAPVAPVELVAPVKLVRVMALTDMGVMAPVVTAALVALVALAMIKICGCTVMPTNFWVSVSSATYRWVSVERYQLLATVALVE
jgi:hypothetical protein